MRLRIGLEDAVVGSQYAFHASHTLRDAVAGFVWMLDQEDRAAKTKLSPEFGPELVLRPAKVRQQAGAGLNPDVGYVKQPLLGPFALFSESWIQRRSLELVRDI